MGILQGLTHVKKNTVEVNENQKKEMYTGLEQLEVKKIMTDFFHFLDDLSLLMYKYGIHLYFWCI